MSWCRFSTVLEDFSQSDLYIYESDYGVEVITAGNRRVGIENAPQLPPLTEETLGQYTIASNARMKWMETHKEFENINLPYANKQFTFTDKDELIEFLTELKSLGYKFPEYVFDYAREYDEDN